MSHGDFTSTERFTIVRRVGAGGMGVVYEAYDNVRRMPVALKTLPRLNPTDLYGLKREFRSLADVVHQNLVTFYELFVEEELCYFTMQLVTGTDFLTYVRGASALAYDDTIHWTSGEAVVRHGPGSSAGATCVDEQRLRACVTQLAEGIRAIHRAGKLHCDLKPSNVMVTPEGQVIILDFGLATERAGSAEQDTDCAGGTPAYMAPEQGWFGPASEASDWYAFGAMLFEALTGVLPFEGAPPWLLSEKVHHDAPSPSEKAHGIPADLEILCNQLLRRAKEQRPTGDQVLAALRRSGVRNSDALSSPPSEESLFVGRSAELAALEAAFSEGDRGGGVAAFVHGMSGMGKTALVSQFLRRAGSGLVLNGRCYESESVPFKALDSVIDALSRHLARLTPDEVTAVIPEDMAALGRVFPVLRRMKDSPRSPSDASEPRVQRRKAFAALRELFHRLARTTRVIVFIDDLQWGDEDSARLLAELLAPPECPVFLVGAYRSDERERSPFLNTFAQATEGRVRLIEVPVAPLPQEDAKRLAGTLLIRQGASEWNDLAGAIARESAGNPYFISELAYHDPSREEGIRSRDSQDVSLDRALRRRVDACPPTSRALLELCALVGQPVDEQALFEAAMIVDPYTALARLKAAKLVRGVAGRPGVVETYHDRVRETVRGGVEPERARDLHERIALGLERRPNTDPELLVEHFVHGGDRRKARLYSKEAARRASEALAFEQAARRFRLAIELAPEEKDENHGLTIHLAEALANAGRGLEAARAYLSAAADAPPTDVSELRRRAAEQLLRSGFIDEGMTVLRDALLEIGIDLPRSDEELRRGSRILSEHLRERGLDFDQPDGGPSAISPATRARIEVFWSGALGLATVDGARAELLAFHHLIEALATGDPALVLRGFSLHIVTSGARPGSRRVAALLAAADALATRIATPDARGWAQYAAGVAAFWQGRPRSCILSIADAEARWRTTPGGRARELSMARMAMHLSLTLVGAVEELRARVPEWTREAEDRDDLYLTTMLRAYPWVEALAADEPDRALSQAADAMLRWGRSDFDVLHWEALATRLNTAIYVGNPELAWHEISGVWSTILSSNIGMATQFRALSFDARGRAALALAETGVRTEELLGYAEQSATELASLGLPCSAPHAHLLRAGVEAIRGNAPEALSLLGSAEEALVGDEGSPLTAMVVRRLRGFIQGQPRRVHEADGHLRIAGVRDPAAWARLYAPGFGALTR